MLTLLLLLQLVVSMSTAQQTQTSVPPELHYLNPDVDPCDDFYEYTCGNFHAANPRPPGELVWDHFTILQQELHTLAKEILIGQRFYKDPKAVQKAKAFYTSCLDVEYVENLRTPQLEVLRQLGKWPVISSEPPGERKLTWEDLARITTEYGLQFFFNLETAPALLDGTTNAIYINSDSLVTPEASGIRAELPNDPTSYLFPKGGNRAEEFGAPLPYMEFLKQVAFRLRDLTHETTTDDKIIHDLNDTIKYMRSIIDKGVNPPNATILPIPMEPTIKVLQNWTDHSFGEDFLNWKSYLNTLLKPVHVRVTDKTKVFLWDVKVVYGIIDLYKNSGADELKNYVMARLLTYMAPDGDAFMRKQWRHFNEDSNATVFSREDYCVRKTLGYKGNIDFSLAVTYEYRNYHYNIHRLEKAANMVDDIRASFLEMLDESVWMDEESQQKAIYKAQKMITLLGYPDEARNGKLLDKFYQSLKVCTWDHFGNSQRLRVFGHGQSLKDIADLKERGVWNISPLVVNAFYHPGNNRIMLPVSILNPIFFNGNCSVLDYGRLGAIIGHEITHGFDNSGRQYNADGAVDRSGLWTPQTEAAFLERAECFKRQYDRYYIDEIDAYVNGKNTSNENLADNGGLRAAYRAFQRLHTPAGPSEASPYTNEQLFFIGFGTMWCADEAREYLELMNKNGKYSPSKYRVIGSVSNMPEFAAAFQCPPGSRMNPVDKCLLW